MSIVIIGANGQLGSDLVRVMQDSLCVALTHSEIEICDPIGVVKTLQRYNPDIVINTAAYHKVDVCEEHAMEAFSVNALGVRNLAIGCSDLGCALLHLSTDYVFDGSKGSPYYEADSPNPLNVYGVSKLAGEYIVRNLVKKHFIVRTSGLFGIAGSSGKGGNFIEAMIRLAQEGKDIRVVDDQVLSPTYTLDLAHQINGLISTDHYGLYHAASHGSCSWYQFAERIFELVGMSPSLSTQTTVESGARALRPRNSELDNQALRQIGFDRMRKWEEGLADYLAARRT